MRITVIMRKCTVALLAEGVDRNIDVPAEGAGDSKSLSSRRAWIEIHITEDADGGGRVALLAEGVDRNSVPSLIQLLDSCRPPRGGRG